MNESLTKECRDALAARADFYRLLSSVYYRELDEEAIDRWARLRVDDDGANEDMVRGFSALRRCLALRGPDARTDFAVDYARIFLAAGVYEGDAACPYESIYTSEDGLMMQDARDEVVAVMAAEGVRLTGDVHEPEDHISFELEFMAHLSERAGAALAAGDVAEYRRLLALQEAFLADHLLAWIDGWGERIAELASTPLYPAVFRITRGYLAEDAALLAEMASLADVGEAA